jgi:hypothetical protein
MAGHRAELADLRVDDGEQVLDIAADLLAVFVEYVVRAGTEPDRRRDVPLVVFQDDVAGRADDEIGVEPAVRELGYVFHDAASADIQFVLPGDLTELVDFGTGYRHRLSHCVGEARLSLAGRAHALHEILGQHDEADGYFPEVSDAEMDHVLDPVEVLLDARAVADDGDLRLDDQRGIGIDAFSGHVDYLVVK